jgi:hypothetical protein
MGMRRWLEAEPESALEIVRRTQETKWPPFPGGSEQRSGGPSTELLMIWAKSDLPAISTWAGSLDIRKDNVALTAKGLLLSRVDAETRSRWLAEAKSVQPEDDLTEKLLSEWAGWNPKPALDAAVATKNPDTIRGVASEIAYGPFAGVWNSSHFGLGVIKDFDVVSLPEEIRKGLGDLEWETIMERWAPIDIGEAARYGVEFLFRTDYAPRDRLLKFFSGHDEYPDEGGMIDRTFCALRVWAVVRPKEMKAWIGTLKDAEMRKAFTWLLENPWGTGPKE